MPGTGNHQIRPGQDLLFRIDATIDFEFPYNFRLGHPLLQKSGQFGPPEGVAGIDERQSENLSQLHGHIAGIGIMPVNDVRHGMVALDKLDRLVHVLFEMRPEQFFAHVFAPPALNADDAKLVIDDLDGLAVV
jgi:hypothetical protein